MRWKQFYASGYEEILQKDFPQKTLWKFLESGILDFVVVLHFPLPHVHLLEPRVFLCIGESAELSQLAGSLKGRRVSFVHGKMLLEVT